MTDQEIVNALIERDGRVTQEFFFGKCEPLFRSIIRSVFSYRIDYDEFVSEFYIYLMEDDARRLRQFQGRSTIYSWLKIVAIRYFVAKRDQLIEKESEEPLIGKGQLRLSGDYESATDAQMDVARLFSLMPNRRYVYVIRRLVLEEADPQDVAEEMDVTVDNLYNIKKRAMAELTKLALKVLG